MSLLVGKLEMTVMRIVLGILLHLMEMNVKINSSLSVECSGVTLVGMDRQVLW